MKFIIILLFILQASAAFTQESKSALFIGNSYTAYNNLPQMVASMAQSIGDTLIFDSHTPGGSRFLHHASNSVSISKIYAKNWDYVVLQGQSQEVAFDSATFYQDVYYQVQSLCDTIRANYSCTQALFYTTWGRQNGDNSNCSFLPYMCTYQGMDSALTSNYRFLAQENQAQMSPVGPVWNYIRNHYPSINLYATDGSHPSLAGSYAAACTFYTLIFKKDPTLIQWNSTLSNTITDSIKVAVKRMAYQRLKEWNFSKNYPNAHFNYLNHFNQVHFFIDSLSQIDSVHWDFDDGNSSNQLNPAHNYTNVGNYTVKLKVYACGFEDIFSDSINMVISNLKNYTSVGRKIDIFPNPSSKTINVKGKNLFKILIYNNLGHLIKEYLAHKTITSVPIDDYKSGVYIIHAVNTMGLISRGTFIKY